MKPYFQAAGITLYHAAAEAILPSLAASSVDLLLTDPPYGISYRSKARSGTMPDRIQNVSAPVQKSP